VGQHHAVSVEPFPEDPIEVLRGPSTLLYGSGAIGGVANMVSHTLPQSMPSPVHPRRTSFQPREARFSGSTQYPSRHFLKAAKRIIRLSATTNETMKMAPFGALFFVRTGSEADSYMRPIRINLSCHRPMNFLCASILSAANRTRSAMR